MENAATTNTEAAPSIDHEAPTETIEAIDAPPAEKTTPQETAAPESTATESAAPDADAETVITQDSTKVVPVSPVTEDRGAKRSFWRRIAPVRASKRGPEASEVVTAQIEALASQLAQAEQALTGRLEAIEHQIDSVWEVEEQLSHLMEMQKKLDALTRSQKAVVDSVNSTQRLVGFAVAAVIATAALVVVSGLGMLQG